MEVQEVSEHEDGSATFTFILTKEEKELLLINGIRAAIIAGIEQGKEWNDDSEASMGNTERGQSCCTDGSCKQSCKSGQLELF